jgi:hypothetical protein
MFLLPRSLIYTRKVLAGEIIVVNRLLVKKLRSLDLLSDDMKDKIISKGGECDPIAFVGIAPGYTTKSCP